MAKVTHNGAPVPAHQAKAVLGVVSDLVLHPSVHQLYAHAPGMDGVKADKAIAAVTGAINEALLHLSAPAANGRNLDRGALRRMPMSVADAPAPTATTQHDHIALETPKAGNRPMANPVV